MNYLSHFYVDHDPAKPHFNFGLMLPDMLGTAQRGWKPVNGREYSFDDIRASEIWQGFKRHLLGDGLFHNTSFFMGQTRYIRETFEKAGLIQPGLRLFFVAHVLLEIMLDRLIIKMHPEIPDLFYDHLDKVSEGTVSSFFSGLKEPVPGRLFHMLSRFKEYRYLYSYTEDERLFFALNRIMERAGQASYPEAVLPLFSETIALIEFTLLPLFEDFFSELRLQIAAAAA